MLLLLWSSLSIPLSLDHNYVASTLLVLLPGSGLLDRIRALADGKDLLGLALLRSRWLDLSVLNLHDAIVQLSAIVLFDRFCGRGSISVNDCGGAEVLAEHVLVETRSDDGAAFAKQFLPKSKQINHLKVALT